MNDDRGFNLLDDPWIITLGADGRETEVSILELFDSAEDLTTIGGEVATQAFAITRLLLAILHRALDGPADVDEWERLWNSGALPVDEVRAYVEPMRQRFDLFDAERPFFQVPELRTAKDEVSPLSKLVADVPNGRPLFTTRSASNLRRIDAAEAARWLVHTHAFDPSGIKSGAVGDPSVKSGKGYPIGTGWSGQIGGVLPQGGNIRETVLLNLVAYEDNPYVRLGGTDDLPPWERGGDTARWEERPPRGAIDLYTWQTRRIRLVGDRDGVTGVVLANGDKIQPQNRHDMDPHTAWRYSEPQSKKFKQVVYMPLLHDPDRSVWRGIGAMLPATAGRGNARGSDPQPRLVPGVLQWIGDLTAKEILPQRYTPRIRIMGVEYGSQSATFDEIVHDLLPMSVTLLRTDRPAAAQTATNAVVDAEQAAFAIWSFAENIAQAAGAAPKSGAGDTARQGLYAALDAPYREWLAALTPDTDLDVARTEWQRRVRAATYPVTAQSVSAAPPSAWVGREVRGHLMNVSRAELWLAAALRKALPLAHVPAEPETAKKEVA
ncbi:type I-E CRISPR-associated protein Cse1/CasA [Nocardia callitridis]|uniref:Type I-E CRISPR-associated protein Cse1/CasA n=1 Tax=Nocardia callitridis TaxID=648753 RepID=A0ABP9K8H2_9NOCA